MSTSLDYVLYSLGFRSWEPFKVDSVFQAPYLGCWILGAISFYLLLFVAILCYLVLFLAISCYFVLFVTMCCSLGSLFVAVCYYLSSYLLLFVVILNYFVLFTFP